MPDYAIPIMASSPHYTIGNGTAPGRPVLKRTLRRCLFTKVGIIFTALGDAYRVLPPSRKDRRLEMSGL